MQAYISESLGITSEIAAYSVLHLVGAAEHQFSTNHQLAER